MIKTKNDTPSVDNYLKSLPNGEQEILEKFRRIIKKIVPEVEERISYGTVVMFSTKYDLVGFVSQKNHLSFFIASPKLASEMKQEITKTHKLSGATIHFSADHLLPESLINKIVTARVKENEQVFAKRNKQAFAKRNEK
jgi:uncharacterized protein YdhG (YjbR/CyaY superfamily)